MMGSVVQVVFEEKPDYPQKAQELCEAPRRKSHGLGLLAGETEEAAANTEVDCNFCNLVT